jgi:DNA-binding response OmpR family regulator
MDSARPRARRPRLAGTLEFTLWARNERVAVVRALVVEDDLRLRSLVVRTLTRAGLACDEAARISEAEELLSLHEYDLLVLDRRLPDGDGLDVCRDVRRDGFGRSILMLTARDDPASTVEGLSDGADDYLGKPFDLDVLAARAHALLRRNETRAPVELACGEIRLDPARRLAFLGERELSLTAREFSILETLMRNPGSALSRETILEQAWGEREEPMSNTIDVLVARLRKKLDSPGSSARIETVRGVGYRLT